MNFRKALQILNIETDYTDFKRVPYSVIKTAYRNQALLYHPDKNKSENAQHAFIEIKDAFDFLTTIENGEDLFHSDSNYTCDEEYGDFFNGFCYNYQNTRDTDSSSYKSILFSFLKNVVGQDTFTNLQNNIFFMVIDKLTNSCKDQVVKMITKIDTDTIIKIYSLIIKHKDVLYITEEIITVIHKIIAERIENDCRVVIYPKIEDVFKKNVYVLEENDKKYYIPTWCSELIYDTSLGELTVVCLPITPYGVYLDDENNVHISATFTLNDIFNKKTVCVDFLNYSYEINVDELYVRSEQSIVKSGLGIPKFNLDNIYDITNNTDIIIHLSLTIG